MTEEEAEEEEEADRLGRVLVSACENFQLIGDDVIKGVSGVGEVWAGASRSTASSRRVLQNLEKVVSGLETAGSHYNAGDECHLMLSAAPPPFEEKERTSSYESAVIRLGGARRYFMSRPKQKEELKRLELLGARALQFWCQECQRLACDLGSGAFAENDKRQIDSIHRLAWLLALVVAAAGDCGILATSYAEGRARHKVPIIRKEKKSWPYAPGEHFVTLQAIVVQKRLAQEQHLLEAVLDAHEEPLYRLVKSTLDKAGTKDTTRKQRPSPVLSEAKQQMPTISSAKSAMEAAVRELLTRPALRALASSLRSAVEELGRAPAFAGNEARGLAASLEAARAAADLSIGFQKLDPLDCCALNNVRDDESKKLAKVQRALATDAAEATADAFKSAIDAISRLSRRQNKPFPAQLLVVYRILAPQLGASLGRGLLFIVGDVLQQHRLLPPQTDLGIALQSCSKAFGFGDDLASSALRIDHKALTSAQQLAHCLFVEILSALSALVEAAGAFQEFPTSTTRRWGAHETEEDQISRGAASRALERASRAFFAIHAARSLLNNLYDNENSSPAVIFDHTQKNGPVATAVRRWLEQVETQAQAHFIHAWKPCWAQLTGDPIPPSDVALIATRFAVFNAHFEQLARSHAVWPELHTEIAHALRSKLRSKLLSKWRHFYQVHAPIAAGVGQATHSAAVGGAGITANAKPLPHVDKLLRWTPKLVEKALASLFKHTVPDAPVAATKISFTTEGNASFISPNQDRNVYSTSASQWTSSSVAADEIRDSRERQQRNSTAQHPSLVSSSSHARPMVE